jgi:septum site-determining protein MinD
LTVGPAIVVTSGKGGTGKTTCTAAIASALALLGHRTVCLDCDIGLRNLDLALGLSDAAPWDFSDVLDGRAGIEDAVVPHPAIKDLWFLAAPSDLSPQDISVSGMKELAEQLSDEYDFCLIDSPAGLGAGFRLAVSGCASAILVATGDAASLRDGQKTVSELRDAGVGDVRLLVNRVSPRLMRRTRATVDDAIDAVGARLLGIVSEDESVALAGSLGVPLLLYGARYAYDQFFRIARRVAGENIPIGRT